MTMAAILKRDSSRGMTPSGRLYLGPYQSGKYISKSMVGVLAVDIDDDDLSLKLKSSLGFPSTGTITIDGEDIEYSANALSTGTLTLSSRPVGAADHAAGALVFLVDADGYGDALYDIGVLGDWNLDTGLQDSEEPEDNEGKTPMSFSKADKPVFDVVLWQSGLDEEALFMWGKDIEAVTVNGYRRMSTTDLRHWAGILVVYSEKGDGSGYEWGIRRFAHLVRSGSSKITGANKHRLLPITFKCIDSQLEDRKVFVEGI